MGTSGSSPSTMWANCLKKKCKNWVKGRETERGGEKGKKLQKAKVYILADWVVVHVLAAHYINYTIGLLEI